MTARGASRGAVVHRHSAGVGTDRLPRFRRPARAHRAASRAVRRAAEVVDRRAVRARTGGHQPVARPSLDAARDLLRMAAARRRRGSRRRPVLHPARPGRDARAVRCVPVGLAALVAAWSRHGSGRSGRRGRRERRFGRRSSDVAARGARAASVAAHLRGRGRTRRGARGNVAGAGHPRSGRARACAATRSAAAPVPTTPGRRPPRGRWPTASRLCSDGRSAPPLCSRPPPIPGARARSCGPRSRSARWPSAAAS